MHLATRSSNHLIIGCSEPPTNVLVVQHLHFEAEVLLHVLDDHHQEGQLDSQGLVGVSRATDVGGGDIRAGNLQDGGLNVSIRDALDVPIMHCTPKHEFRGPSKILVFEA